MNKVDPVDAKRRKAARAKVYRSQPEIIERERIRQRAYYLRHREELCLKRKSYCTTDEYRAKARVRWRKKRGASGLSRAEWLISIKRTYSDDIPTTFRRPHSQAFDPRRKRETSS